MHAFRIPILLYWRMNEESKYRTGYYFISHSAMYNKMQANDKLSVDFLFLQYNDSRHHRMITNGFLSTDMRKREKVKIMPDIKYRSSSFAVMVK